jgi:hypothetical protein
MESCHRNPSLSLRAWSLEKPRSLYPELDLAQTVRPHLVQPICIGKGSFCLRKSGEVSYAFFDQFACRCQQSCCNQALHLYVQNSHCVLKIAPHLLCSSHVIQREGHEVVTFQDSPSNFEDLSVGDESFIKLLLCKSHVSKKAQRSGTVSESCHMARKLL